MMHRKIIALLMILSVGITQSYNKTTFNDLQKDRLAVISEHQPELGQQFKVFLKKIKQENISLDILLDSDIAKNLYELDIREQSESLVEESVQTMQYYSLLLLYEKTFKNYISSSSKFLDDLFVAKKYWAQENFHMNQSFFNKSILYNFYTSKYQETVNQKLAALYMLEDQAAAILGFSLYALHNIDQVNNEHDIIINLGIIVDQFCQLFNAPAQNIESKNYPVYLYNHLLWIHENLNINMHDSLLKMKKNEKTPFLKDHWVGVSCVAITTVAAVTLYYKNKEQIHSLYTQGKVVVPNFLREYVVNPLVGLKEVWWDGKAKKLEHVEHFPDIPKFSDIPTTDTDLAAYDGYTTLLVNPVLNPLVRVTNTVKNNLINTANEWKNDVVDVMNNWKDASEKTLNKKIDEANDTIIKNNQANMYLATIGPILFGTYQLYALADNFYNKSTYKHWHLPMKHIIRFVDQLINKAACGKDENTFINNGKLYMLTQHLNKYIVCLDSQELFLMQDDIAELLSFDLTYNQKKGIVDRMYKTYEFLK